MVGREGHSHGRVNKGRGRRDGVKTAKRDRMKRKRRRR